MKDYMQSLSCKQNPHQTALWLLLRILSRIYPSMLRTGNQMFFPLWTKKSRYIAFQKHLKSISKLTNTLGFQKWALNETKQDPVGLLGTEAFQAVANQGREGMQRQRRGSQETAVQPEYSLEGLILKLKLQYFGQLIRRTDSLEKPLMLGKIEGRKRMGRQRMRWLDGITDSMDMSLSKLGVSDGQGGLACCGPWGHKELNTTEQLNWT